MKKIIIVVLLMLISGALIRSMQEAATSSTSATTQTTSKKRPASNDDDNGNESVGKEKVVKKARATNLIKIPMVVQIPGTCPDGMIKKNTLYLDLSSEVPVLGGSFADLITEQLKESKPVILAVTTTKFSGTYTYHIYEAASTKWFYDNDFSRNRYTMIPTQFPTEPTNRQPIMNEVMFFILYDINKPVEYIGSDYDLFQGTDNQKSFLSNTLLANDENLQAISYMAYSYYDERRLELAEQYFKQAADKGDVLSMNNLGFLYYNLLDKPELAEPYFKQAANQGDVNAMANMGVLYQDQNKLDLAEQYYRQALQALQSKPDPELEAKINQKLADIATMKSEQKVNE